MSAHAFVKGACDYIAGGIVVATLFKWLPLILAVPSAVYACIRVYETKTVQKFLTRFRKGG